MSGLVAYTEETQRALNDAKTYPVKGRIYVYETFKARLNRSCLSSTEYQAACIELAKILNV